MAFRCQDFPNPVHASLGPSFVRMMSHPCSGNVYSSWLLPRPSAQQPSTLQHALFPGRDPIRWGVEETAGVGEWHEKTTPVLQQLPLLYSSGLSPESCVPENLCARNRHEFRHFHVHLIQSSHQPSETHTLLPRCTDWETAVWGRKVA